MTPPRLQGQKSKERKSEARSMVDIPEYVLPLLVVFIASVASFLYAEEGVIRGTMWMFVSW
tara:strand:- start:4955 stop:5137 length:183 start_codon:yes stop_codon:yes gene_type:complete